MFILHYAPDNASLIVRLALEEMGLAYETRLVDRATRAQKRAAYRALNPRGQIPVLETPEGPLFETAAILLFLSEASGQLAPPPGASARGMFLSWLFAVSNGLHAELRGHFYAENHAGPDPRALAAHRQRTTVRIGDMLDHLDALTKAGHGWFGAETPSVLDLYVAVILRWLGLYPLGHTAWFRRGSWPGLAALAARIELRPSMQRAALAEGLGPTPLTAPRAPDPPVGRAT